MFLDDVPVWDYDKINNPWNCDIPDNITSIVSDNEQYIHSNDGKKTNWIFTTDPEIISSNYSDHDLLPSHVVYNRNTYSDNGLDNTSKIIYCLHNQRCIRESLKILEFNQQLNQLAPNKSQMHKDTISLSEQLATRAFTDFMAKIIHEETMNIKLSDT